MIMEFGTVFVLVKNEKNDVDLLSYGEIGYAQDDSHLLEVTRLAESMGFEVVIAFDESSAAGAKILAAHQLAQPQADSIISL